MSAVDLIVYRASTRLDGIVVVKQTATTIQDQQETGRWLRMLEPWLRAGDPLGVAYLNFRSQAAFLTWQPPVGAGSPRARWQQALAFVGPPARVTGTYALELPDQARAGLAVGGSPPADGTPGPRHDEIEARARSAEAMTTLTALLAHALQGTRRVTMPWTGSAIAEAVAWGLITIVRMTGESRPVSFFTHAPASIPDRDIPGLLVSFHVNASPPLPAAQRFTDLAANLAGRFADDPAGLRRMLEGLGVPAAADDHERISRLLTLPPRHQPGTVLQGSTATVTASFDEQSAPSETPSPSGPAAPSGPTVMCPICLGDIHDWDALDYWRWDPTIGDGEYVPRDIPPDLNPTQRRRFVYGAYVRCPAATDVTTVAHYLPARYGSFGDPVLLGFVGLTQSGKTHLLASMIGQMARLSEYGVQVSPLDRATHQDFLEKSVEPLMTGHQVLPGTPDDASTTLTDALIIKRRDGRERVVALFDVSGGDLVRRDSTKEFLWIADGLFFVVDPEHMGRSRIGDGAFSSVLDIVGDRLKKTPVSAAIVLNKADKARFDEPIARWLRAGDGTLDPTEFLRESADVYAYLERHDALALAEPFRACHKATLHVASPTGGAQEGMDKTSRYPRGVTPLRVLRPLVAMLAMTGVLTGPEAEQVGI